MTQLKGWEIRSSWRSQVGVDWKMLALKSGRTNQSRKMAKTNNKKRGTMTRTRASG